ncbi:MAG: ABC transporter permease [Candidatus Binatia bacterium]
MNHRLTTNLTSILTLALVWEALGRGLQTILIPPLSQIGSAWLHLIKNGGLLENLIISLGTLVVGFFLALTLGVAVGVLMGSFEKVEHCLDLYINGLMASPTIAFIPVLILWFGLGVESRIAVVFLFSFFVIAVNTMTGVKYVDSSLVEMARSFGAKGWEVFYKVQLPAALPMIMAGVKLGVGRAVKGMVTGEVVLALTGTGAMIMQYGSAFATDALFAIILTILAVALIAMKIVEVIDRYLTSWKVEIAIE